MEVPGYTELVTFARDDARRVLERRIAKIGADGAVLTSSMRLQIHALEVGESHTDHVAEASMAGDAVVRTSARGGDAAEAAHDPAPRLEPQGAHDARRTNELGIPEDAMRRLAEMRPGQPGALFTSDLSVNEFLLVREAGFRPLGLVLGSSIYHVGLQIGRWSQNMELDTLSQAMYHARELAMTRMEAEADALGADGIVGVRLEIEFKEFGNDLAEFIAVGTAVKSDDRGNWRNDENKPFTSDLSGQDFWTLIQAGYAPLGMVMGSCVYHIAHQGAFKAHGQRRPERRDPQVHRGPLRRPRARDEPDAGRGRAAEGRRHRRRPAAVAGAPLGRPHDRVLRHRHRRAAAARRPHHRQAAARPAAHRPVSDDAGLPAPSDSGLPDVPAEPGALDVGGGEADTVQLLAAALRADLSDLETYERVLVSSIAEVLPPGVLDVSREALAVGSRRRPPRQGDVDPARFGDSALELVPGRGSPTGFVTRQVRGVAISRKEVSLEEWTRQFAEHLERFAAENASARAALGRLLGTG